MNKVTIAFKIAFIYFLISFIWILASDNTISFFIQDIQTLNFIQTIKGWFFITITSILLYILIHNYFKKEKKLREDIENIFNQSGTPFIIYDNEGKVLRVNKVFEELTGYKFQEINTVDKLINKMLKNKKLSRSLIEYSYNIDKKLDIGEFEIDTKDNKTLIWHLNCSPYGNKEQKKIIIGTALDITELKQKENIIIQQSKMAALGEVLENIAHQWRQPLSSISTIASGVKMQKEHNILDDDSLLKSMDYINSSTQYLSSTIDDFRDFFKPSKNTNKFNTKDIFNKINLIIGPKFHTLDIKIVDDIEDMEIKNYENALVQVLVNIFNNASDALEENGIENKLIFIDIKKRENKIDILIKDNAGGIKKSIINKIFEPYFTTKFKSKGTGIGLYMTEEIITKHMRGSISASNKKFIYKEKEYTGAEFLITLPLNI